MKFEAYAAHQLAAESQQLTERWSRMVAARGGAQQSGSALLHMASSLPAMLQCVARFVADAGYPLSEEVELAALLTPIAIVRRRNGSSPGELVDEFDMLARVLDGACIEWLRTFPADAPADAIVAVSGRLNRAPLLLAGALLDAYWSDERTEAMEATLRAEDVADVLSRELTAPLNAATITVQLLESGEARLRRAESERLLKLIRRNLERADAVLRNVRQAVRPAAESSVLRLPFGQVLASAIADLQDEVAAAGVRLEVDDPMPMQPVPALPLRAVLSNLIRSAVQYRRREDPAVIRLSLRRSDADDRWQIELGDGGALFRFTLPVDVDDRERSGT